MVSFWKIAPNIINREQNFFDAMTTTGVETFRRWIHEKEL